MTNEMIIFNESQKLAKEGKISYTGRTFKAVVNNQEVEIKETEPIHTYAIWQELGYQVQKGQKAITKITIWKHTSKHNEETDEDVSKIFMKTAAFFSQSQVEKVGA